MRSNPAKLGAKRNDRLTPVEGGKTVFVVEDEAIVRNLLRMFLEGEGYRILEADSLATGRALWEKEKDSIDLLVIDMFMPDGVNGTEMARGFCQDKKDLQVIYMSGYDLTTSLGPEDNFIQKPFSSDELSALIRKLLEK